MKASELYKEKYTGQTYIVKAIVVILDDDLEYNSHYKYRVRVVSLHGLNNTLSGLPDDNLPFAKICLPVKPNSSLSKDYLPSNGDVVYVSFEGGDPRSPIILGYLGV